MSDFTGIGFDGDNFQVNSSSGTLEIRNARGKFIKYGYDNVNSNVVACSYLGKEGGVIDGRNFNSALGVMIDANYFDNQIYAGNGGVGYKLGDAVYTVNQSTREWSLK